MRRISGIHVLLLITLVAGGVASLSMLLASEARYGRVTGVLTKADGGQILPGIRVALVSVPQSDEGTSGEEMRYYAHWAARSYSSKTDEQGRFTFPFVEAGKYMLVTYTNAHRMPKDPLTVADGAVTTADYALEPTDPFLRIFQPQHVFTSKEEVKFNVHGFVKADELAINFYRMDNEAAVEAWRGWYSEMGGGKLRGVEIAKADLQKVSWLHRAKTLNHKITKRDVEGIFREALNMGKMPRATYLVSIEAGKLRTLGVMAVTDLALVVKATTEKALVYAVDLTSGETAAGAAIEMSQISYTDDRGSRKSQISKLGSGKSDSNGLFDFKFPTPPNDNQLLVVGRSGDSLAVADVYVYGSSAADALRVYTYTDRPVYRPGHTVQFKSVIRRPVGRNSYTLPGALTADAEVRDGSGNIVYTGKASTNSNGSLSGNFTLDENAIPGGYSIQLTINGNGYWTYFAVAEYKKPEFEVTVSTGQNRYTVGDNIAATISAQYYFGAPVSGATVEYEVTREPNWYSPESSYGWDYDIPLDEHGYDGGGEMIIQGTGTLDDSGRLTVNINTSGTNKAASDNYDWRYSVHASVQDISQQSEEGNGGVLVTQGDFRLETETRDYLVRPGQTTELTIRVVDYNGVPQANVSGASELLRTQWVKNNENFVSEISQSWVTDAKGVAVVSLSPRQQGDYRVRSQAKDARGHTVTSMQWLWVMKGDSADFDYPYQNLQVRPDKTLYRAGETAEIVINTKYAPRKALLTIEGDTILEQRVIELKTKSTVVKVPVRADFMPNMQVDVCFVKDKHFFTGEAVINVSRERKALNVQITSNKAKYLPGEQATFTVKTTTPDGKPAPADISLGVVDEAIYAIRPDDTEKIISYFYPRRWNSVNTAFSFPEIYLSGDDKAGSTIKTRKFFPDTAFWQASAMTNSKGLATFTFTMPDSLTSWRATVRAATADAHVGQATYNAIVSKPFLVRLETPRFMTQGDEVKIAVIAHNLTAQAVNARIGLNITGLEMAADAGNKLYYIDAGKAQRVTWTVRAPYIGSTDLRAWAQVVGGRDSVEPKSLSDAMQLTVPVLAKGRKKVDTRAGSVADEKTLTLPRDADIVPGTEKLTIRLMPSLASSMLASLEYLTQYPYGCVEQTVSSFLPDVLVEQLLKQTGLENEKLRRELPKMVNAGLLRLYSMQEPDGGWGWWSYDQGDPWMTAYVVFALQQAQQAGYKVSPEVYQSGVNALRNRAAKTENMSDEAQAFVAYVLAETGNRDNAEVILKRFDGEAGMALITKMGNWSRALLALARFKGGREGDGRALLDLVWRDFNSGDLTHVYGKRRWEYHSEMDIASVLLFSAASMNPQDPRLEKLIGWLLERQQGGYWYSTRATAFTLYGMTRYLAATGELKPDFTATVTVDGNEVATKHFTAADIAQPAFTVTLGDLKKGLAQSTVKLTRSGAGKLYYSVAIERMGKEIAQPLSNDADLTISRRYFKFTPRRYYRNEKADKGQSETSFSTGDTINVVLKVTVKRGMSYVMIEDPLPAGCEAQDRGRLERWEWSNWWAAQVIRDEMVSFAVRSLDKGETRTITYQIHASTPGKFTALPARIFDMYDPGAWADTGAAEITVRD